MKKFVFLSMCLFAFAANGYSQKSYEGEKGVSSVGVIAGHVVSHKGFTIGVDYRYNVKDKIRLAPSALYVMKNDKVSSFYINADAHYLARITNKLTLYPIGGVGVSFWKKKSLVNTLIGIIHIPEYEYEYESETVSRMGLNLGLGAEMRLTKDIIVGAEFKNNITHDRVFDQLMLLARVAYYF